MYATDNTTHINSLGLAIGVLLCLLMLALPRRHALWPLVAMICMMTMGQRVLVLDLNFTLMRILLLCGLLRVLMRGELGGEQGGASDTQARPQVAGVPSVAPVWTWGQPLDRALLYWVLASIAAYTLLWQSGEALVNRLGLAYDALGTYVLCRALLRDSDDLRRVLNQLALWVPVLAASMVVEKQTGTNLFAVFGGVPPETLVREGVLRAQGPFAHPILAGAFGSAMLPLMVGLVWQGGAGLMPWLGLAGAGAMVVAAASSGPLLAATAGFAGLLLWPLRAQMRAVRWLLLLSTLALHLAMAAPVWFLIARASIFGGSTGYHRAILIDHAIRRFADWWLVGVRSTADWGYHSFDVTNQYVLVGVQGGLLSLVLFVLLITRGFGAAGTAVRHFDPACRRDAVLAWSLGCSLLVHAVNYLSVPYFDQNVINWYVLLAMLATAAHLGAQHAAQAAGAGASSGLAALPPPAPRRRSFRPTATRSLEAGR